MDSLLQTIRERALLAAADYSDLAEPLSFLSALGVSIDHDEHVEEVSGMEPWSAEAFLYCGTVLSEGPSWEMAIQFLSKAIELDSRLATAYMIRGEKYVECGLFDLAATDIEKAETLGPDDPWVHYKKGSFDLVMGRPEKAISSFDKSIGLDSTESEVYYNRGLAYAATGDMENAFSDFTVAMRLDPDDPDVYWGLGKTLIGMRNYERAVDVLMNGVSRAPEDPHLLESLGAAHLGLAIVAGSRGAEHLSKAATYLSKAAEVGEYMVASYKLQVITNVLLGNEVEAERVIDENVKELDPEMESLSLQVDRLNAVGGGEISRDLEEALHQTIARGTGEFGQTTRESTLTSH